MLHRSRSSYDPTEGRTLRRALLFAGCLLATFLPAPRTAAHVFSITDALVVLKSDDTYEIDLRIDVDALALGVSPATDSSENVAALREMSPARFAAAIEGARETLSRRTRLRFDGEKQRPQVTFPQADAPETETSPTPTVLGVVARLSGTIPPGATELTFGLSRAMGPVQLTLLEQETVRGVRHTLGPGEDSPPYPLGRPADERPATGAAAQYVALGFEHILPGGLDHVLFVLGLFLLAVRTRPLLWQITAFTLAHSVTLGLSMGDVISLPSSIVEPLIALSIAYVAIENLFTTELKPWRAALVFGFGLLHGLGFAGALRDLGLPQGQFLTGLLAFNVGVELGQLAVILLALATIGWFRRRTWYRTGIVRPLSIAIAAVGLYWTVERIL